MSTILDCSTGQQHPDDRAELLDELAQTAAAAHTAAAAGQAHQASDRAALDALTHLSATAHTDGQEWVKPAGAHDAYPAGAEVTHAGSTWTSLTPFNVWTPGESGWRQKTTNGPAAWIQPTGAHDAYPAGAEVTHNNQAWRSTVDANVWEPGHYGWTPITQE